MGNKKLLVTGRAKNGVPVYALSPEKLKEMGFPRRKVKSDHLGTESHKFALDYPEFQPQKETETLVRQAITAASTATYLRAVIAISFSRNQASVKVIQPLENRLDDDEYLGCLVLAYVQLTESPYRGIAYFRESNATHMIEGGGFAEPLIEHVEPQRHSEMVIINVHHDYINIYHNISHLGVLLQVIRKTKSAKKA